MTFKERLKRAFTSDSKRYGLKYTLQENILSYSAMAMLIVAAYFALKGKTSDSGVDYMSLAFAGFMAMLSWVIMANLWVEIRNRRIRELGGDTFYQKGEKDAK